MRKEIFIAVVIGLFAGLFVTYGLYRFRSRPSSTPAPSAIPLPTSTETDINTSLVIDKPLEGHIQKEAELSVSGSTTVNATVLISVGDDEYFITADGTGNFAQQVELQSGVNTISIHAFDEEGTQTKVDRTVVRLDVNAPISEASSSAQPASSSATPRPTARPTARPNPTATPAP